MKILNSIRRYRYAPNEPRCNIDSKSSIGYRIGLYYRSAALTESGPPN
ncbi:hypothetical protein [Stieleria magnilauensis]|uniref:Uncharacterized protein n=1 Tax=Stieleria magnilauensis TaxID=2527963 RepID=A0ABX5XHA0_9BACT|nr:hypothetical protein TBK1r_01360 [Planctomycetes bacterium TBK1r]